MSFVLRPPAHLHIWTATSENAPYCSCRCGMMLKDGEIRANADDPHIGLVRADYPMPPRDLRESDAAAKDDEPA